MWRSNAIKTNIKSIKQTSYHMEYGEKIDDKDYNIEKYDNKGRLIQKEKSTLANKGSGMETKNGEKCAYTYDLNGNLTQILYTDSTIYFTKYRRFSYSYDDKNILIKEKLDEGEKLKWMTDEYEILYSYDEKGHVIEKLRNSLIDSKRIRNKNEFDEKGNWVKDVTFLNNNVYAIETFEYNDRGQIIKINSLDKETGKFRPMSSFTYDQSGRILKQDDYYSCDTRFTVWSEKVIQRFTVEYDTNGLPVKIKSFSSDLSKHDWSWEYSYDSSNRLIQVVMLYEDKPQSTKTFEY